MKTKTQAIQDFLLLQECGIDLYLPQMEVQVNVISGPEQVKKEKTVVWTNGIDTWSSFRIPYKGSGADAEPNYKDDILDWDMNKYAEAIGLSGWDWFNRQSKWVGFDFDSISNHSQGLTDDELDSLRTKISDIPWVTLRRSKSGKGFHLYIFFADPVSTQNHFEHAALARAILSQLSALLDFKFEDKVDVAGGILWIWHKEASTETQSFKMIKEGKLLDIIPSNWKEYIVVKHKRTVDKPLQELISATKKYSLTEEHKRLLYWLANQENLWWWDADRGMLVTHTVTLKNAYIGLGLKGLYETNSTGKNLPCDHNCFAFPLSNGAWIVYRFSINTKEDASWTVNSNKWSYCTLNKYPDFNSICRRYKGVKTKSGQFRFPVMQIAQKVLKALGIEINFPPEFLMREATLTPGKFDNEIIVSVPYIEGDKPLAEWYQARGKIWEQVVTTSLETRVIEPPDEVVRHVTAYDGNGIWFVNARNRWVEKAKTDVKSALVALGYAKNEVDGVLGTAVLDDWQEVIIPFEEEYPGNRRWNRKSPQLAFEPKQGLHPTWDMVFNHVGKNVAVQSSLWCKRYGISTGSEYLRLWYASILRHPLSHLPYLFLVSVEENTGKSLFHEAFSVLLKNGFGYNKADLALTNDSGFNGELYGTILSVVEEVDLSKSAKARERIKDYVTSPSIFIRFLNQNGFLSPNTTHWIQCANDPTFCPVFPGDTRITVIYVDKIQDEIPKEILLERLKNEACYFLYTLLNIEIPPPGGRLRIPVLEGTIKGSIQDSNRNRVLDFIEAQCEYSCGCIVSISNFVEAFHNWLPNTNERLDWNREKIIRNIPLIKFPKGRYGAGGYPHIGNIKIKDIPEYKPFERMIVRFSDGKLGATNETN